MVSETLGALKEPRAVLTTVAHGLVVSHWRRLDLELAYLDAPHTQSPALWPSPEDRAEVLHDFQRAPVHQA